MSAAWRVPVVLAGVSFVGIAAAIVGDGVWDWICWAALSAPLAACGTRLWRQWPHR